VKPTAATVASRSDLTPKVRHCGASRLVRYPCKALGLSAAIINASSTTASCCRLCQRVIATDLICYWETNGDVRDRPPCLLLTQGKT